jgi:thiol-disulfide isomerase/thioredoxin
VTRRKILLSALGVAQDQLIPVREGEYQKLVAARKGKVLLVDFWATWCAPCREEMPLLVKLEAGLRPRGFSLLTVSADESEQENAALAFLRKFSVPAPWYIKRAADDEKFISSVDPKWGGAVPALFLYDRQGRKAKTWIGETAPAEIEAVVRKLL